MRSLFTSFFFLSILLLVSTTTWGQRRGGTKKPSNPAISVAANISHGSCGNQRGNVSYTITSSYGWGKGSSVHDMKVTDENNSVVYVHNGSGFTGTINNLPIGAYTFSGSVITANSAGYYMSMPFSSTIWIGIETVWAELNDMTATPNNYSAQRSVSTTSYGGARSSNYLSSGNGWIEMKADYGTNTGSRVYWVIGETDDINNFNPNSPLQYIEFYHTSSGSGIRVRHVANSTGFVYYTYTTISTNRYDKIRLVRDGATLTIQKNNSTTTVFTFPQSYSGPLNIGVFTREVNDRVIDAVSTFDCTYSAGLISHAQLQRKLTGGSTLAVEDQLKFSFDGEYQIENGKYLAYEIYSDSRVLIASSSANGSVTGGASPLAYQYDDNRYSLPLSGMNLTTNKFYTLVVTDSKGSKRYLKFMYK